jgi:hypothetical protein
MQSQPKSHSKPKRSVNNPLHAKLKFYRERIRSLQEKIAYKRSEIDSIITPKTNGIRIQSSINNHRLEQQLPRVLPRLIFILMKLYMAILFIMPILIQG